MYSLRRSFATLLKTNELASLKSQLPNWSVSENKSIHKRFVFKDFKNAWEFMGLVAKVADQHDHHPEWKNVYNTVDVTLTTHSAGGITENDVWLAKFMDMSEGLVKFEHDDE